MTIDEMKEEVKKVSNDFIDEYFKKLDLKNGTMGVIEHNGKFVDELNYEYTPTDLFYTFVSDASDNDPKSIV